ncbi:flavin-containing amine [Moniliophthora roreri]|nr:flavin-containing amine [Moniliophthora roreri]
MRLPSELICAIGSHLPLEDIKTLRRCSHRLGNALQPILFKSIAIDSTPRRSESTMGLLKYLEKEPFSFAPSVANLAITTPTLIPATLLESGLSKLRNIRVIRWRLDGTETLSMIHIILTYMSSLSSLREWHLTGYTDLPFPFPFDTRPIHNLSVLSITGPFGSAQYGISRPLLRLIDANPALMSLSLDVAWSNSTQEPSNLEDFLGNAHRLERLEYLRLPRWKVSLGTTISMPALTALDLTHTSAVTGLWSALLEQGIRLRNLTASILDADLLAYLASYSGLQNLALVDLGSSRHADALTQKLYEDVLPMHGGTLVSLAVESGNTASREWCLSSEQAGKVVEQCESLEHLKASVRASDLMRGGVVDAILSAAPASLRSINLARCAGSDLSPVSRKYDPCTWFNKISSFSVGSDTLTPCDGVVLGVEYVYLLDRRDGEGNGFVLCGYKRHWLEQDWVGITPYSGKFC